MAVLRRRVSAWSESFVLLCNTIRCCFVRRSLLSPMQCTFAVRSLLHGIMQRHESKYVGDLPCSQRWRETNEEKRALERSNADMIAGARHSAEVHRQASN